MNIPKILVGSPVTSLKKYSIPDYIKALNSLTYKNKELLVLDNSPEGRGLSAEFRNSGINYIKTEHAGNVRKMLARDRNFFREKALNEGFDYWLSIEQDIIPPQDVAERLLENRSAKIVSGAYFNFSHEKEDKILKPDMFCPINPKDKGTGITRRLMFDDLWPSRPIKVFVTGIGCLIIQRDVLEKIKFRFNPKIKAYDDLWFCRDAFKLGFEVLVDSRVSCKHMARLHSPELMEKLGFK